MQLSRPAVNACASFLVSNPGGWCGGYIDRRRRHSHRQGGGNGGHVGTVLKSNNGSISLHETEKTQTSRFEEKIVDFMVKLLYSGMVVLLLYIFCFV